MWGVYSVHVHGEASVRVSHTAVTPARGCPAPRITRREADEIGRRLVGRVTLRHPGDQRELAKKPVDPWLAEVRRVPQECALARCGDIGIGEPAGSENGKL